METIDIHSHITPSKGGPSCDFQNYHDNVTKLNIVSSLLAPGACPEIRSEDGSIYIPCVWKFDNTQIHYIQKTITNGVEEVSPSTPNPYHNTNVVLFEKVRAMNRVQTAVKYLATPLYHAQLDSPQELADLISQPETVGIKVHGIASFVGPKDITSDAIKLLRSNNLPLIVHTDCYMLEPTRPMHHAYVLNDPIGWVEWAVTNDVKLVALHGACLCERSIKIAKGNKNIIFGLSPDLLMMSEPERLKITTNNFLLSLFSMAEADQIAFDIDYSWNTGERGDWNNLDWNMKDRIIASAIQAGYTNTDLELVFHKNARRFFNL